MDARYSRFPRLAYWRQVDDMGERARVWALEEMRRSNDIWLSNRQRRRHLERYNDFLAIYERALRLRDAIGTLR